MPATVFIFIPPNIKSSSPLVGRAVLFMFLNGCVQSTAFLGPAITVGTTGNIFQASVQYGTNQAIKKETGKNSIVFVKDEVVKSNKKRKFHKEFSNLVEKRVTLTHKKIKLKLE